MIATAPPEIAVTELSGADQDGSSEPPRPRRRRRITARHVRRVPRAGLRWATTPSFLRIGMVLACLPVAFFITTVQLGVARNDSTVRTVGRDATRGIASAQAIKLNLAELHEIVAQDLLDPAAAPLTNGGFPADYNTKRSQLHDNMVLASSDAPEGAAFRQPLANIEYALSHYHALVRDAFAASAGGDTAAAARLYGQAHLVMDGTLLPEADFVDKANTYVLNDTYDRQKARSASTVRLMVASWVVLVGFLLVVQVLLALRFRRLVNLALAAATLMATVGGAFALVRLDTSASELTRAREEAFDAMHVLARAQATVVSARQAEGQYLLDPGQPAAAREAFDAQASKLLRAQDGSTVVLTDMAQSGVVPEGAGGYFATVAGDGSGTQFRPVRRAIVAFGDLLASDADLRELVTSGDMAAARLLYRDGQAFVELTEAVAQAQGANRAIFDDHVGAAVDASAHVGLVTSVAGGGVLVLVIVGLYLRLREYGT